MKPQDTDDRQRPTRSFVKRPGLSDAEIETMQKRTPHKDPNDRDKPTSIGLDPNFGIISC